MKLILILNAAAAVILTVASTCRAVTVETGLGKVEGFLAK
jgi:hypothetical protein